MYLWDQETVRHMVGAEPILGEWVDGWMNGGSVDRGIGGSGDGWTVGSRVERWGLGRWTGVRVGVRMNA